MIPILPDQVSGCPFLKSGLGKDLGVSERQWCRDGCSLACAPLMIYYARATGRW